MSATIEPRRADRAAAPIFPLSIAALLLAGSGEARAAVETYGPFTKTFTVGLNGITQARANYRAEWDLFSISDKTKNSSADSLTLPDFTGNVSFTKDAPTAWANGSATFGASFAEDRDPLTGALTGYTGSLSLEGKATADPPKGKSASARSKALAAFGIEGRTVDAKGKAKWMPQGSVMVSGDCTLGPPAKCTPATGRGNIINKNLKVKDPILFEATSLLDGSHVSETLFSFDAEITDGLGLLTFADDSFTFYSEPGDGLSGYLIMDASSSILENPGRFELTFTSGIVTTALFTGAFAGIGLPQIGSALSGTYAFTMPEFRWDAGWSGETAFSLAIPLSGEAAVTVVPEPGAWALMIAGFGLAGATLRRRTLRPA